MAAQDSPRRRLFVTARRIVANLLALVRRDKAEQDLDDELQAHLEASAEDLMRRGMSRDDAVRASRRDVGSVEAVKDRTRDAGWESAVDGCWRDVTHAVRSLRKAPSFSVVAVAILALGIGAITAIFSVLNALLLRPLPVHEPGELVTVAAVGPAADDRAFSYAGYRRLASDGRAVIEAVATSGRFRDAVAFEASPTPEPVDLKWVSGNYFTVLGVAAASGRTLRASDDQLPSAWSARSPVAGHRGRRAESHGAAGWLPAGPARGGGRSGGDATE
jgi:hypothetical protein